MSWVLVSGTIGSSLCYNWQCNPCVHTVFLLTSFLSCLGYFQHFIIIIIIIINYYQ